MESKRCACGQKIMVRRVCLDVVRTFFLGERDGRLHVLTACPRCGTGLALASLREPPLTGNGLGGCERHMKGAGRAAL